LTVYNFYDKICKSFVCFDEMRVMMSETVSGTLPRLAYQSISVPAGAIDGYSRIKELKQQFKRLLLQAGLPTRRDIFLRTGLYHLLHDSVSAYRLWRDVVTQFDIPEDIESKDAYEIAIGDRQDALAVLIRETYIEFAGVWDEMNTHYVAYDEESRRRVSQMNMWQPPPTGRDPYYA
jgi:hypothetical protein